MTDDEFNGAVSRSGLPLKPETVAELRKATPIIEAMIARATRDKSPAAEPALIFYPEQRP